MILLLFTVSYHIYHRIFAGCLSLKSGSKFPLFPNSFPLKWKTVSIAVLPFLLKSLTSTSTKSIPGHDIFLHDQNQDGLDNRTGKPVEVIAASSGMVASINLHWEPSSPIRGGNFIWIYDPVSIPPRQSRGLYDCWPLKGAWSQSIKIKTEKHSWFSLSQIPILVILAKAGIQFFSGFRVAFHLPGMTILLPKMSNLASPPAEPGVYLRDNYPNLFLESQRYYE